MPQRAEHCRLLSDADAPGELVRRSQDRSGFAEEYPFRSHWAELNGRIVHYIDEGTGPVLLMSHGNPTWSFIWRRFVREFARDYRIVAVDHLGCGFSEKPQSGDEYTLAGHINRLQQLVELLGLRDITLFGHDWGGAIGMGCAVRNPERFRRFVLMNTAAFRSQKIPFRIAVCRIPLLGRMGVQGLNLFARAALRMAVERPLEPAAKAGLMAPWDSWQHRIAVQEFVRDIPLHPGHRSYATLQGVEEGLTQFREHRMLLVWGMKDWCFTPEFFDEFCHRFPGAERLPLADAGHYVFEDAHERILPRVRQFLSE